MVRIVEDAPVAVEDHPAADRALNACAGPFGAFYDFYIERPRLMRLIGRALWGIDAGILYESMEAIASVPRGATVVDVPCGGGVAFRALRPDDDLRYIAADLDPRMLARAERRRRKRGLVQVELVRADMTALPFADGEADLFLSLSGIHMVEDKQQAVMEMARCLKPGGELVGTSFFSDCSRRARMLFELGRRRGHAMPPSRAELRQCLESAGLVAPTIGPQRGFAAFHARKLPEGGGE